ncbi:MAG TPA: xanthine dehydrogenase family protein molybdopterin-binding subunit [Candidatus Acidoferrum sp.]|nr:xanthine dehydrogenase family protein molybdopterin-binding subunit [Candidatus Acidoferrum sp.]
MIGAAVPRVEDARLLSGQGRYVGDLTLPGMRHAAFVRSPHAHARIVAIDVSAALQAPGVVACVTGEELTVHARTMRAPSRMRDYRVTDFPALALGKVRHVGEAVAVIVATNRYVAEDAAELVAVEYEPLPVVSDVETALGVSQDSRTAAAKPQRPTDGGVWGEPQGPPIHEEAGTNVILSRTFSQGDVDAALAGAAVVVGDRFRFHRHAGVAIENRACAARWDAGDGSLTLWSSTQIPGIARDMLAELLGLAVQRVRVIAADVGGGFGIKTVLYPEEIVIAALARIVGAPVRWIGDRREDLLTSTQAWDETIDADLGVDAEGRIVGLRARVAADLGAYSIYPWTASIEVIQVVSFLPGPYRVANYRAEALGVATNKAPMGPYRGVGRPVSVFVTESLLDRAARRLGLDPAEIRRRNLLNPEDLPYRSASGIVWDSGGFQESLTRVLEVAGYSELRGEQSRARAAGRCLGIGIASYVELTGVGSAIPVSPGAEIATGTEGATVRVEPGGGVVAIFGLGCQGQGHETTLAQVVAGELGVSVGDVRVLYGDTAVGPHSTGTYASRSAVLGGGAAILAARAVRDKALAIAAHQLEASVADLTIEGGVVRVRGVPGREIALGTIATIAYAGTKRLPPGVEPGLEATKFYDPYFGTASNATHLAVVEIDPATWAVRVLRHVVAEDCGRVINPLIASGQTIGGVAQGIGAALLEEVVYDGDGQLLTASLMDYLVPTAGEVPPIEVIHLDHPSPTTLGGFKGVGEGGTIGAPAALANAVADALAPLGIDVTELPVTGERLFRLVSARDGRAAHSTRSRRI